MWKLIRKLFEKPNLDLLEKEAYADGKASAEFIIANAEDKSKAADDLFHQADGSFNTNSIEKAFDRGVNDQLYSMGYQAPYQNGQF